MMMMMMMMVVSSRRRRSSRRGSSRGGRRGGRRTVYPRRANQWWGITIPHGKVFLIQKQRRVKFPLSIHR